MKETRDRPRIECLECLRILVEDFTRAFDMVVVRMSLVGPRITPHAEAGVKHDRVMEVKMNPMRRGYAKVNGISLYHEIYGQGEPLVLIHGGLTTIGEMQGWIEPLAMTRQVIAMEMQGHGHTPDTDRPMSFVAMGDDIAALLDHLEVPKADLVGHSFGGASAIRAAIQHPDCVRRLVVISSPHARSAWYPETQEGMSRVGASMVDTMMQTPTGKLSREWPEPQRFPQFLDKFGKMMSEHYDWSAEIAKLTMPVLLVFADNDSVPQQQVAAFFALLGGGIREPGWQNTRLSTSRLAIVPGYSHYNFITSPEVPRVIGKFLVDPLSNTAEGAAAASRAAPATRPRQTSPRSPR
jgi:pimeloyl-ACP methyl ester carboxylesterase